MSDDFSTDETGESEIPVAIFEQQLHGLGKIDWFLSEMVEMAELGFTPHLVLTLSGAHVSGKLISAKQYFDSVARAFEQANIGNSETINTLVARFREHAAMTSRMETEDLGQTRRYIHLENARFHTTDGKTLPANGVNMRFKMLAVDGFSFGELKPE